MLWISIFIKPSNERTHLFFSYLFNPYRFEKVHKCDEIDKSDFGGVDEIESGIVTNIRRASIQLSQLFTFSVKLDFHFEQADHVLFYIKAQKLCRITPKSNSLSTLRTHFVV